MAQLWLPGGVVDHHRRRHRRRARVGERIAPVAPDRPQPVGCRALAALGTLLLLLRGFTYKTASGGGYSVGLKWGAWVLYILAIAVVVGAVMNLMASGEKIAWDPTAMNKGGGAAAGGVVPRGSLPAAGCSTELPAGRADYPPAAGSSETPTV